MLPRVFALERLWRENEDTFTLELAAADGGEVPAFRPGQFNMIYHFGVGEVPISISGDPAERGRLLHTIRAVGAVTRGLCTLKKGDPLGLRGPFGSAWPVAEAEGHDVVLVAGGIGLAPLRPTIYHLLAQRQRYGRIVILYGARSQSDLLYPKELESWRGRFDVDLQVTVDHGTEGWYGHVGVVTQLIRRVSFDPAQTVAMTCGPEVMMRFAVRALEERGVGRDHVWVSLERNMKCAIGFCGHCQFGPTFICRDGAVYPLPRVDHLLELREV
ncbi:MAG: Ni/Fe hydrogenase subunit gamma [Thermoanaerobaculia bacterium]|nr:Ni/Fe hydrogenase subunit gamma [Thermoanaerobaculia bacterium]